MALALAGRVSHAVPCGMEATWQCAERGIRSCDSQMQHTWPSTTDRRVQDQSSSATRLSFTPRSAQTPSLCLPTSLRNRRRLDRRRALVFDFDSDPISSALIASGSLAGSAASTTLPTPSSSHLNSTSTSSPSSISHASSSSHVSRPHLSSSSSSSSSQSPSPPSVSSHPSSSGADPVLRRRGIWMNLASSRRFPRPSSVSFAIAGTGLRRRQNASYLHDDGRTRAVAANASAGRRSESSSAVASDEVHTEEEDEQAVMVEEVVVEEEEGMVEKLFEVRTIKEQTEVEAEVELVQRDIILVTVEFEHKTKKKLVLFKGIMDDIKRRLVHYPSDFTDGLNAKAAAATLFLSFACLTPCIAFGGLTANLTNGAIGVVETIVGTAASGIAYALFAGQPLTLLGPTGLIVVFIGLLNKACDQLSLPFLPTYSWVGIWSALFLIVLAATEASDLVRYFTRFTDDTFSALISLQFITEAVKSVTAVFKIGTVSTEGALLSLLIAVGTYAGITILSKLRNSRYFVRAARDVIADFGPPLTIIAMSCVPLLLFPHVSLPSLYVPSSIGTTTGRPWAVEIASLPLWGIAAAAIPAALLSLLIFLDQNITTRLVCGPQYPLRKGQGYHLDMAVLGVIMGVCSFFGLPWMTATTVPSLSHIRSLAVTKKLKMINPGSGPSYVEYIEGVQETRLTGIAVHLCVGASLLLLPLLRLVPMPVTYGVFLYMGISSLGGNQFVERLKLCWCDPDMYPQWDFISSVPRNILHAFTALQLSCLAALWTLKRSKWGILFPVLIVALLPIRNYLVPRIIPAEYLRVLDAH